MQTETSSSNSTKNIVIFDGECVLCNGFFQFLLKKDLKQELSFATLQSNFASKLLKGKFINAGIPDSVLFFKNGKIYTKSTASLKIISNLGGIWRLAAIGLCVPKFIRNSIYDLIARNRYRWWGKRECLIPDTSIKSRFID